MSDTDNEVGLCKPNSTENKENEIESSGEELMPRYSQEGKPNQDDMDKQFENIEGDEGSQSEGTSGGTSPTSDDEHDDMQGKLDEISVYDFVDETYNFKRSALTLRPPGFVPRKRVIKKTTLHQIMLNMEKHRKLDMMENYDEDFLP